MPHARLIVAGALVLALACAGLATPAWADDAPSVGELPPAAWAPAPESAAPSTPTMGYGLDRTPYGTMAQSQPVPVVPKGGYARAYRLREDPVTTKDWNVAVGLYGFLASLKGDTYVDGQQAEINVTFEELLDRTKGGIQGVVGVRYKRFFAGVDFTYAQLEDGDAVLGGLADLLVEIDQKILDFRFGYTVVDRCTGVRKWGTCAMPLRMSLDAVVGVRYWKVDTTVRFRSASDASRELVSEDSSSWLDPYIGVRFHWDLSKRWTMNIYGDIGGFGIGDASEFAWQVQALLGYRITRRFAVFGGWRTMGVDQVEDTATGKNGSDFILTGPMLGAVFRF